MLRPKTIFALLAGALLCIGSATIAHADVITFTGTRDFSGGQLGAPNSGRCGAFPPNVLVTLPTGVGASNVGSFSSTESHCVNPQAGSTHNLFNGLFTFDFGDGNSFFGTYVGTVVGVPPFPIPPGTVVDVTFTYTLTGGTGSFLGATGTLLGIGLSILNPPPIGTSSHIDINGTINTVPEPATFVLLGSGLASVVAAVRKRRKSHRDQAG